ncbi:Staphylococcal nuclease homologue [Chryseobacterium taklimakanense]|uniref:Staphylococcal nuclease homologue n=1 Tax=Chryseobacterium taklimakanense TaxID=536441 RepID=A0A239WD01_9FLAO|nr:thermonuclease family protein [Chryseobacterium taklimakanense]SNV32079.1 Staphylococcal nuclease homologue [Chryseobacterium taklimakanense]
MKYNATSASLNEMEGSTTGNPSAKYFQIKNIHVQPFWIVEEVLDGDSLKVKQEFTKESKEIRLYGLDAPEVHLSRKMREDEAKSGIPASLLLQYGMMSLDFVLQVAPPGTRVTLLTEKNNQLDFWMRELAYVILPNGDCLNELLLQNGWAKASHNYYCTRLPYFQEISRLAQINKQGIYQYISIF